MIEKLYLYLGIGNDPYHNLAVEETLLHQVKPGECILYLWQNAHTVVIGRNQNALAECDAALLEREGGRLARRLSGGGAVYHDLGNLNFTFLVRADDFDKSRQTEVILRAVNDAGIPAERNGRNDLTCEGRKFSGHAYYQTKEGCYHHGTLMLDVDTDRLTRYLRVSPIKLSKRGVPSVRSRVMNLREKRPDLTVEELSSYLIHAAETVYGCKADRLYSDDLDGDYLKEADRRYADPTWRYGDAVELPHCVVHRFDSGLLRLDYELKYTGSVASFGRVILSSDALDTDLYPGFADKLTDCSLRDAKSAILEEGETSGRRAAALEVLELLKEIKGGTQDEL